MISLENFGLCSPREWKYGVAGTDLLKQVPFNPARLSVSPTRLHLEAEAV